MAKNLACILLGLLFFVSESAAAQTDTTTSVVAQIESLVRPHAEAGFFSGVIFAAKRGETLFRRGYGFSNFELQVPNTPDTRFGIASVTKVMTQVVVGALVREGRLDLGAPVEKYIPGFPRGPGGGIPTVAHLLDHQAGVPHRVTDDADETQPLRPQDIVDRVRETGLLFEPGTSTSYSSAGYTCLARVVEIVTGEAFETVVRELVFAPVGMSDARSETRFDLLPRRAEPYRLGVDGEEIVVRPAPFKNLSFLTGAGSVYATAEDLADFTGAILGGVFGDSIRTVLFDAPETDWQLFYGRTNGYEASVEVMRSEGLTLVVLSNLQSASTWQIKEEVKKVLTGDVAESVPIPPFPVPAFEEPATLVGQYGPAEIRLINGSLFRGDNEFYPIVGERYYTPGSGSMMRFRRDSTGAVDALVSIRGDSERVLVRN